MSAHVHSEKCYATGPGDTEVLVCGFSSGETPAQPERAEEPQDSLLNPVSQVYFRAGLIACREYMARFVEAQDPIIANSIRANWWPSLGKDYGPPRKIAYNELTAGEYGTPEFRCMTAEEVSPTLEALPIALGFLLMGARVPHPETEETK